MVSVVSYLDCVYMENPEGESLTSIMVCAGWTIIGTTVRRRCPSEDTWKKIWRPLREGSLTIEMVMLDGPSQVQRSVVGVRQGTLERNMETLGKGSLTVMMVMQDGSRGYDDPS